MTKTVAMVRSCMLLPLGALIAGSAVAQSPPEQVLREVQVQGEAERADGPVTGYRATRSGTA